MADLRFLFMDHIFFSLSHCPVFLPFLHFSHHCVGRAPTPQLPHWPADFTNSFTAFLSRSHDSSSWPLCTQSTLLLKTLQYHLLQRPPRYGFTTAAQIPSLPPALVIFLYLLCVNTAHTYKCAHGQRRSVFIRARDGGMPVVWAL